MGRHVLSVPRHVATSTKLQSLAKRELFFSKVYVLAALAFSLGCLCFTDVIPYISKHRWNFFICAGSLFTFLNVRDLIVLLSTGQRAPRGMSGDDIDVDVDKLNEGDKRGDGGTFNCDSFSATMITAGSIMLLNAGLLAIHNDGKHADASQWQFTAAFACYIVGFAANTLTYHEKTADVIETRNTVVFQISMASTLNLAGAITNVPGIGCTENEELRSMLQSWLHGIGGVVAIIASLVNHFHTIAFVANEEILFAETRFNALVARREAEEAVLAKRTLFEKAFTAVKKCWTTLQSKAKQAKSAGKDYKEVDTDGDGDVDDDFYVPINSESEISDYLHTSSSGSTAGRLEHEEGSNGEETSQSGLSESENEEDGLIDRPGRNSSRSRRETPHRRHSSLEEINLCDEDDDANGRRSQRRSRHGRSRPRHADLGAADSEDSSYYAEPSDRATPRTQSRNGRQRRRRNRE